MFTDSDVIHRYTRAEAIEDGVLVDVSGLAREAGFTFPVAMTRAAFERTVSVPEGLEGWQDETGRLWDVLYVGKCAAKRSGGSSELTYQVRVQIGINRARNITLKMHCVPGDEGEGVITIMLPGED